MQRTWPLNALTRRKSHMKIGEEEAQSNNWKFGKSEGKNKNEGSLKSKAQKTEDRKSVV